MNNTEKTVIKSKDEYDAEGSSLLDEKKKITPAQRRGGRNALIQTDSGLPAIFIELRKDFFLFQNIQDYITYT